MIDIHSHILPGVDDGVKTMDEAIRVVELYLENGYKGVITTPHYREKIYEKHALKNQKVLYILQNEINKRGYKFFLLSGSEGYLSPNLAEALKSKRMVPLGESFYTLVEFPLQTAALYAESELYRIALQGYTPIIAHPERYNYVQRNPNYLCAFIEKGYPIQINLGSLQGTFGEKAKKTAEELIKADMVHFLATDTHNSKLRSPSLGKARNNLLNLVGEKKYHLLMVENPRRVVLKKWVKVNETARTSRRKEKTKKKAFFEFWKQ